MVQSALDFINQNQQVIFGVVGAAIIIVFLASIKFFKPRVFKSIRAGFDTFPITLQFARKYPFLGLLALMRVCIGIVVMIIISVLEKNDFIMRNQEGATVYTATAALIIIVGTLIASFLYKLIDISAIHYTIAALESKAISLTASVRKALVSSWLLIKFVLLDYLITILIRSTQKRGEKDTSFFQFINIFISSAAGLAWSAATYFITPVIAHERVTLRESIRRSVEIMKNNFGQTIGFGLGSWVYLVVPFFLFILVALGILCVAAFLEDHTPVLAYWIGMLSVTVIISSVCIIVPIILMLSSITTWIFKSAAYNYTQGKSAGPFYEQISQAVLSKKNVNQ